MGGGAWPFLVGGVICLVNSDNERDLIQLNSYAILRISSNSKSNFLEGLLVFKPMEVRKAITGL